MAIVRRVPIPKAATLEKVFVDKALNAALTDFERLGGTGTRFVSSEPFSGLGRRQTFYLVKSLPPKASPNASINFVREEGARKFVEGMLKSGTPVVISALPPEVIAAAAALGNEFKLAADALAAGGIRNRSTIVLLQPNATKLVIAHEFQHWGDFEDPALTKAFSTAMKPFLNAKYLTPDDKETMSILMWELRGHGRQAAQALTDGKAGAPFLDEGGNILTKRSELAETYKFEAQHASQLFDESYMSRAVALLEKIRKHSPADARTFARAMESFDLSKEQNLVTFRRYADGVLH